VSQYSIYDVLALMLTMTLSGVWIAFLAADTLTSEFGNKRPEGCF